MTALYTFGRCETPYGHINLESYMGPAYAHATFYRTDGSDEPLTMAQIGAIIAAGIGDCGQPGEYSFEEVEDTLMLLQAELFQQKYEVDDGE